MFAKINSTFESVDCRFSSSFLCQSWPKNNLLGNQAENGIAAGPTAEPGSLDKA